MKFQATLCVLATLVAATFASTVTDVKNDLQSLTTQSRALDNTVQKSPASGVSAGTILGDVNDLAGSFNRATSTVKDLQEPITQNDGQAIQAELAQIIAPITDLQNGLQADLNTVFAGGLGAQASRAMQNLKSNFSAYENALKAIVPAPQL